MPSPNQTALICETRDPEPHRRQYETLQAAAERLHCTTHHVRRLIAAGDLTGYRFGKRMIRVDADELDALLRPIAATERAV